MSTLLAIIPHPDDESYAFGGTIALAARAGWRCLIECASYGEKGKRHDGGGTTPNEVADAREQELIHSCRVLGAKEPRFWGLPDGELRAHRGEQARIARLLRAVRPDIVLTLGPDGAYGHPDHVALHRWVREAWESLAEPRPALLFATFPRGLFLPQYEKCIGMMGNPPSPRAEDIGGERFRYEVPISGVAATKVASIAAHQSQLPGGEAEALFPPGIVRALLAVERFEDASGQPHEATSELLAGLEHAKAG
jgi:LmbE family N-acetylglucosaminyl deacetylase